jgi:hypothetical protein
MESKQNYYDDLKTIKKIMEESSRFLSLSGLSGLFAGLTALIGGAIAYTVFLKSNFFDNGEFFRNLSPGELGILKLQLFSDALIVLILSIGVSLFFSYRKSVSHGLKIWTPVSKRLLTSLIVPLVSGGLLIAIIYFNGQWQLIIPSMLIFYGLALVNACKFTYNELFYMGLIEICTGLAAAVFPEYGIFFWCFGFGILHIFYGVFMYRKYEG